MNFIWDPIQNQLEARMLPACKLYVHQKGDLKTILKTFKVPKTPNLYPVAFHAYGLGQMLQAWRLMELGQIYWKKIKL